MLSGGGGTDNGVSPTRVHFQIRHKAFELIDGNRLILDSPPAVVFAGMGAHPAADKQQGIAFPYGVDGILVGPGADMRNVLGNVYLGGACLSARRQRIVFFVEVEQAIGHGSNGQNVFGAGRFACAASHAFFIVYNGESIGPQFDRIEITRSDTIAQAQTADMANAFPVEKYRQRTATVNPHIVKVVFRSISAQAGIQRFQWLYGPGVQSHYLRNSNGGIHSADDTDTRLGFSVHDCCSGGRTPGIAASPAIGAGGEPFDLRDTGIFIDIEYFRRDAQHGPTGRAQRQHKKNSFRHVNLLGTFFPLFSDGKSAPNRVKNKGSKIQGLKGRGYYSLEPKQ